MGAVGLLFEDFVAVGNVVVATAAVACCSFSSSGISFHCFTAADGIVVAACSVLMRRVRNRMSDELPDRRQRQESSAQRLALLGVEAMWK